MSLPSQRKPAVWFDALGYGRAKLLAGAPVPWSRPGELAAFFGKLQAMFASDAILVDVGDLLAQRVTDDLRSAMGARTRPGYALRTLLADVPSREAAVEAVRALAATKRGAALLLVVPEPAGWLADAARLADVDPGAPDPDRGALYAADFLRAFAGLPVDGLLLDAESQPIRNLAEHYGWGVVLRSDPTVWRAGADFWTGAAPPPDAAVVLATVPAQGDPDVVMKRVRGLA